MGFEIKAEKAIGNSDGDILGYSEFADTLANTLILAESSSFIGMHAPWGSGKTSLLNLLDSRIVETNEVKSLIFDAWDYENSNGMLPKMFSEIAKLIPDDAVKKSWYKVSTAVLMGVADVALSKLSGETLEMENLINTMEKLDKQFDSSRLEEDTGYMSKYFSELLRDTLKATRNAGVKRIVFLIDDLDRCHPENIFTFIDHLRRFVALVERFRNDENQEDYPDLVGLIAFDRQVVSSSILAKYPNLSTNPIDYLFKLVNLTVKLPLPEQENIEKLLKKHLDLYSISDSEKIIIASSLSQLVYEEQGRVSLRHAITLIRQYAFGKAQNTITPMHPYDNSEQLAMIASSLLGLISPEHFDELLNIPIDNNVRKNCCDDISALLNGKNTIGNINRYSTKDEFFWKTLKLKKIIKYISKKPSKMQDASQLLVLG